MNLFGCFRYIEEIRNDDNENKFEGGERGIEIKKQQELSILSDCNARSFSLNTYLEHLLVAQSQLVAQPV